MVRGRSAHRRRELGRCCGCSASALFAKKRWKGTEYEGGARSFYLTAGRSGQLAPWVPAPPRVCYNRRRAALLFLATARRRRPVRVCCGAARARVCTGRSDELTARSAGALVVQESEDRAAGSMNMNRAGRRGAGRCRHARPARRGSMVTKQG
jgi:hypothetical protein